MDKSSAQATEAPEVLTPLRARDVRAAMLVTVNIGKGRSVLARKLDMAAMLFEGLMPMPILTAAQQLISKTAQGIDPVEQLDQLEEKKEMLDLLRRHACIAVVEPTVVEKDDGNIDHMPASLFSLDELMVIWKQTAIIPMVAPATARRFRQKRVPDVPATPSASEDVRPSPKLVDSVEVIGQ